MCDANMPARKERTGIQPASIVTCNIATCNIATCNIATCNIATCNIATCNIATCNIVTCNMQHATCNTPAVIEDDGDTAGEQCRRSGRTIDRPQIAHISIHVRTCAQVCEKTCLHR